MAGSLASTVGPIPAIELPAHNLGKGADMALSAHDLQAITEAARDLAYRQIDVQLQASDNFDVKALGVLAFDGVALAAILAAKDLFYAWSWAIPSALIVIAAVLSLIAIQSRGWDDGPDPRDFYDKATSSGATDGSASAANVELISELGGPRGSIANNDRHLRRKSGVFTLALWVTVEAGLTSAILVAIR
jgi:hypothetical protein